MPTPQKSKLQTTTVRLPKRLYEEARSVVAQGESHARSLNDLLVDALKARLKQLRRARIDAEFAGMRTDTRYQRESTAIAEQFAVTDWEAFGSAEKEHNR